MPTANGVDGEFRSVMIDANADAADIRANVIDAVGNGFAQFFVDEVMHVDLIRAAFRPIVAACILVGADQFFFLVSTEMTGWPAA
jgi:hypothetical protein